MHFQIRKTPFKLAFLATLLALGWVIFAPARFGGQVEYVIVNGNSMLPLLQKGDLVILRKAPFYQVGDIVTYSYPGIGPVIHRIIARELDRFVLRGDHNDWVDAYRPGKDEILGKRWLTFPAVGKGFLWLRTPWGMAGFISTSTLIVGVAFMQTTGSTRRRKIRDWMDCGLAKSGLLWAAKNDSYFIFIYITGIISIILFGFAFTRPVFRNIPDEISYQHTGFYTYSAPITDGVYNNNRIETGDAIFPSLNCHINLLFDYRFHSPQPFQGGGTNRLVAEVTSNRGWHRTINLQPEAVFTGNSFHIETILDTCQVENLIQEMQEITGFQDTQYFLSITPSVHLKGILGGRDFKDEFTPVLQFQVESRVISLVRSAGENGNLLQPIAAGYLAGERSEPNTLNIFGLPVPVWLARFLSLFGLLLAVVGITIPALLAKKAEKTDEKLLAHWVLGGRAIEARGILTDAQERIIDFDSLADLIRLSDRLGEPIFLESWDSQVNYLVRDQALVYRYQRREPTTEHLVETPSIPAELNRALECDEFVLFYQPTVSLDTGKIVQIEALLRWLHPVHGLQTPQDFLPAAEKYGLVPIIDDWVLQKACAQLDLWRTSGYPLYPLSLNLSVHELSQVNFAQRINDALKRYNLPPHLLHIEVEEESLRPEGTILENLHRLKEIGIGITVNTPKTGDIADIGSVFDINQIKIGRSLVQRMPVDQQVTESARRCISTAHERKINVVAVGIETSEQLGFFRLNSCDAVQGYFISPPLTAQDITRYLRKRSSLIDLSGKSTRKAGV